MKVQTETLTTEYGATFSLKIAHPTGGLSAGNCLFIHGFSPDSKSFKILEQAFTQGRYKVFSLAICEQDIFLPGMVERALAFLAEKSSKPILAVGHGLAGAILLSSLAHNPIPQAVACIGSPGKAYDIKNSLDESPSEEEAVLYETKHGPSLTLDPEVIDALQEEKISAVLKNLRVPNLILHSPQDEEVDINAAATLYNLLHHPKSYISLNGADHYLSDSEDAYYAGSIITQWAARYCKLVETEPLRTHMEVVTKTPKGTFTTQIRAGNHTFYADEPTSVGGKDLGPTPYDLLNAALGACTSMTLQMYANRKKWPLEQAIVHLKHDRVHVKDCENCPDNPGKIERLSREVEIIGPLSEEQHQRLLEIADKCPVHKTLTSDIEIITKPYSPD